MEKRILITFLFVINVFSLSVYSQNKTQNKVQKNTIDSIETIINKAKTDSAKIDMSLHFSDQYSGKNIDISMHFATKAKNIAEQKKDTLKIADALMEMGWNYYTFGNYPLALESYFKALKINESLKNKNKIAVNYGSIGLVFWRQANYNKALEYFANTLKLFEETKNKNGIGKALGSIGNVYIDLAKIEKDITKKNNAYKKALDYSFKALKIREEVGNKSNIATTLGNIGIIYYEYGKINPTIKDSLFTSSEKHYHQALKLNEEMKNKEGIARDLGNLGSLYTTIGKFKESETHLIKALKISTELNTLTIIRDHEFYLSRLYDTLSYLVGNGSKIKGYENLAEIRGNALTHYKKFITARDTLNSEEREKHTFKLEINNEYEKKELKAKAEQEKKDAIVAEEKQQNRLILIFVGLGLAIVVVFSFFLYKRFKVTERQKVIIEKQKHIVEEKHKEITDSINYAERIQRSFLATKELLDENLNDYFVLFQPKDIVSGDFYWATKLSNGNFALATADSTGHGVPGAIMSLLNITSLESAIKDGYTQPAEILNATRKTIIERLKKDGSADGGKDGMDCSLTIYDFNNKKLFVTAANNPVWIVRGVEVIEIKPDKMTVGKHDKQDVLFTQHEIDLQKGDVVYTLTDGFPDQFGGENGKKFMSKKLRELLLANVNLPMQEQKLVLQTTFKNWVGDLEQVDDVCVIGVRV